MSYKKYCNLINFSICEEVYHQMVSLTDYSSFEILCNGIRTQMNYNVRLNSDQNQIIIIVLKMMERQYDESVENSAKYIKDFFINEEWKKHIYLVRVMNKNVFYRIHLKN
tara:strand:- start:2127 stop:2456 length:330 start_codon:yes stop_codon:yes gene_type:complete